MPDKYIDMFYEKDLIGEKVSRLQDEVKALEEALARWREKLRSYNDQLALDTDIATARSTVHSIEQQLSVKKQELQHDLATKRTADNFRFSFDHEGDTIN